MINISGNKDGRVKIKFSPGQSAGSGALNSSVQLVCRTASEEDRITECRHPVTQGFTPRSTGHLFTNTTLESPVKFSRVKLPRPDSELTGERFNI